MIPASQPATSRPPQRGAAKHDQAGDDLDDADQMIAVAGAAGDEVVELRREVAGPVVREHAGELVDAEQDRGDGEDDPQQQVRLRGGVGGQVRSPDARARR